MITKTVEKIIASYLEERKTTLCCLISKGGKEAVRKELEAEGVTVEDGSLIENAVQISDYDFFVSFESIFVKEVVMYRMKVPCCVQNLPVSRKSSL